MLEILKIVTKMKSVLIGLSVDWTCPRKDSVSLKIYQYKLPKQKCKKEKKKKNKQKTLEHQELWGNFIRCNVIITGISEENKNRENIEEMF